MSYTISAIETRYAGCRFRSRLEARWAVFFDALGVKWQYEPQGYLVGKERRPYLPDFWLPEPKIWFEVKGSQDSPGFDLWGGFCDVADPWGIELLRMDGHKVKPIPKDQRGRCVLAYGDIPVPGEHADSDSMLIVGDCNYEWCICDRCGYFGAEFSGRIERLACGCHAGKGLDLSHRKHPDLARAYAAARSARFEHRER